ncbi:MAG: tetratricopeptide repeat protein [Wenzhouxiangella sp.]
MSNHRSRLSRILGELRRRHVYRVMGAYAIAAWFTVAAADVVLPALLVPFWVNSIVVFLAIVGLPITAVLAWMYDITPQGVVRTPPLSRGTNDSGALHWNWRWLDYLIIAGLLAILTFVLAGNSGDRQQPPPERSVAVLPFNDLSPDRNAGYFCDGMAEAILDSLARVPGLQVVSRTSSFAFRDRNPDIREVAETLGVGTVLEGSVRKAGDRIRISARLIHGKTGRQLWNETYESVLEDVFAVQDNISRSIVDVFRIRVFDDTPLVEVPTRNQQAYEEYLRGRDHLRRGITMEDFDQAIARFERALALDADFGLARAGMCSAYWEQYDFTRATQLAERAIEACQEAQRKSDRTETLVALGNLYRNTGRMAESRSVLTRAVASRPNSADALAGFAETLREEGDLEAAQQHLQRAIELDPGYWRHHMSLARVLQDQGRIDESISHLRRAIRLEPGHPRPYRALGGLYYYQGDYLRAAETTRQSVERNPNPIAYSNVGAMYFNAGEYAQAEAMFRQALTLAPDDARWHGFLAQTIEMQDEPDFPEARKHRETAIRLGRQRLEVNPADHVIRAQLAGNLAAFEDTTGARAELVSIEVSADLDMLAHQSAGMAYLELGEHEAAIRHFEAAKDKGYPPALFKQDPRLEPLFDHPAFVALVGDPTDPPMNNNQGELP